MVFDRPGTAAPELRQCSIRTNPFKSWSIGDAGAAKQPKVPDFSASQVFPLRRAPRSLLACLLILLTMLSFRFYNSDLGAKQELVLTRWDAFGYYYYLPAPTIYHDYKQLAWADSIDKRYNVTGGDGMPVQVLENGNKVSKYLCGVAILEAPFFAVGHWVAGLRGDPQDGFSPPYQYALGFGAILYVFLALLLLRRLLLRWFEDGTVAWTLLLITLATNLLQYAAVDSGLSHAWIFPLYVLVIRTTLRWHQRPDWGWALVTGFLIGFATICRPTEAVMLFIPLLWGLQDKTASGQKWSLVRANPLHVPLAVLGGLLGILPQLIYWKAVTGSFIYDVGSKWQFLSPWFRVLTGFEKGWFIYTPVTLLFIAGLFFLKRYPFRWSVLIFSLLNIWIVIAWDDWQYGGTYSARALVQSYPVFAFALAALLARVSKRWRLVILTAGMYLTVVNLFQTWQYDTGIIHHRDMNRAYYGRIYLNPHPTPLEMSLLDRADWPDFGVEHLYPVYKSDRPTELHTGDGSELPLYAAPLQIRAQPSFLRIQADLSIDTGRWNGKLGARLREGDSVKLIEVRLANPVGEASGHYRFYVEVPAGFRQAQLEVFVKPAWTFAGRMEHLQIDMVTEH